MTRRRIYNRGCQHRGREHLHNGLQIPAEANSEVKVKFFKLILNLYIYVEASVIVDISFLQNKDRARFKVKNNNFEMFTIVKSTSFQAKIKILENLH